MYIYMNVYREKFCVCIERIYIYSETMKIIFDPTHIETAMLFKKADTYICVLHMKIYQILY